MTNSKIPTNPAYNRLFRRLTLFTVITVYLLIIAGGIVRSTGAGMGCPDWPQCFGSWVPPTEVSQLPSNYKELYGAKLKGEVEFNAVKTWIEYVNRLLGAFTGVLIFITLLASLPFLKSGRSNLFYGSLAAFILVGFQGWLGSKVVSSELHPLMVTLHMVVAIIIVFILLYVLAESGSQPSLVKSLPIPTGIRGLVLFAIGLSLIQIVMGTQVRESMDLVINRLGYSARSQWMEEMGLTFYIHRSFSILVLVANGFAFNKIRISSKAMGSLYGLAKWVMILLALEILTGVIMAYFAVPAFAQPMHLTLAVLIVGVQFVMWLNTRALSKLRRESADFASEVYV